ncbi:MAG: DUF58 domain-containing protein [Balneolaceae bacterium]
MESPPSPADILKRVRTMEIRTRGLVQSLFGGEYQSAFKGRGMAFSEVRAYSYGDDIRQIDWNVTARTGEPFVKIFEEEREQTLMICLDVSGSSIFGSGNQSRLELAGEVSALLAYSAISNGDKVGLLLFGDQILKLIPPKKGKTHILRLIRELIVARPTTQGTDLAGALRYMNRVLKRRAIVTLLSDFEAPDFEKELRITHQRHDLVALRIEDPMEIELPDLGLIPVRDPENGESAWIDSSSRRVRHAFKQRQEEKRAFIEQLFRRSSIDHVNLSTNRTWIQPLSQFFLQRSARY